MFIISLVALSMPLGYVIGNLVGWKLFGKGKFNWRVFAGPNSYFNWIEKQ